MWKYHSSVEAERLYPTRDGVLRQWLELREPSRVHRPVGLETAAHPIQELLFTRRLRRFHGVMKADQPDALLHQLPDRLEAVPVEEGVALATVAINDHRRRSGKSRRRILWPAVAVNLRGNARNLIQAGLEQQTARAVLMVARAMAGRAGEEDDLFCLPRERC